MYSFSRSAALVLPEIDTGKIRLGPGGLQIAQPQDITAADVRVDDQVDVLLAVLGVAGPVQPGDLLVQEGFLLLGGLEAPATCSRV